MIARSRLRPRRGRADPRRARRHPQRLEDLTTSVDPSLAAAQMGPDARAARRAARHRARSRRRRRRSAGWRGSPASARSSPPTPDYAEALQEIGPAAIKLGQALSTRPDLVGERGRGEPVAAPGRPAARAVRRDQRRRSRRSFGAPLEQLCSRVRRGAGRRRLDRPGPPRGHDRRPRGRGQGAAAGHRGGIRRGDRDLRMGRGACRGVSAARPSGCGRGWSSPISGNGPRASSTCSARPPRPPSCARIWSPSPASTCPRSTGGGPRGGC